MSSPSKVPFDMHIPQSGYVFPKTTYNMLSSFVSNLLKKLTALHDIQFLNLGDHPLASGTTPGPEEQSAKVKAAHSRRRRASRGRGGGEQAAADRQRRGGAPENE
ncbi:phenylacetone monooxygenase [Striga asiatica]|uniref:Phenylacetone monooxygenase n=1 Tax=Striga asiatica TaxID=4170 RepID=A0A5A7QH46_STRAF|nr:phenylacetone monooxygenase [Striga asiatica]